MRQASDSLWDFSRRDFVAMAEIAFTAAAAIAAIGFIDRPIIEKVFAQTASAQAPQGPPVPRTWLIPPIWLQELIRRQKTAAAIVLIIVGSVIPTAFVENPMVARSSYRVTHTEEELRAPTARPGLNIGQMFRLAEFLTLAIVAALVAMMVVGPLIAWYLEPMNPPPFFTRWEYRFIYLAMALGNLGLCYALEADDIAPILRSIIAGDGSA